MVTMAAGGALCLGSGPTLAKPTLHNHKVRNRPLFTDLWGDSFFGFADISTMGLSLDFCDDAQGEEQFFEVYFWESGAAEFSFAYVKAELGSSCPMSALPSGVSLIRVMGRCPDGVVELTSFDGTTLTPEPGQSFLVGDPIVIPEGCDEVFTHQVVFEFKPLEGESIDVPHPHAP